MSATYKFSFKKASEHSSKGDDDKENKGTGKQYIDKVAEHINALRVVMANQDCADVYGDRSSSWNASAPKHRILAEG